MANLFVKNTRKSRFKCIDKLRISYTKRNFNQNAFRLSSRSKLYHGHYHLAIRYSQQSTALSLKSMDTLPSFTMSQNEQVKSMTDAANYFEEKYAIAKQHDNESPMIIEHGTFGSSVILFSHDIVKQWQEYELQGRTKRFMFPHWLLLFTIRSEVFGKGIGGSEHLEWRKKLSPAFKPEAVNKLAANIQQSAT
eukprot:897271_1